MKLTQELIDKIQEAMLHTNLKGEINWKDGEEIVVQIAGTFAKDKFIVLKNRTKDPVVSAQPHPNYDYENVNLDLLTDEEFEELCRLLEIEYYRYYTGKDSSDE